MAIDASSGKVVWTTETGSPIKTLVVLEKAVFAAGSRGRVTRVASDTGKLQWHDDLQSSVADNPIIIGGEIYFATSLGNLYGYMID